MERGSNRLNNFDLAFVEKTQSNSQLSRSKGVILLKEQQMGSITLYSAMLAQAKSKYNSGSSHCRQAWFVWTWSEYLVYKMFDAAVREQILLPDNGADLPKEVTSQRFEEDNNKWIVRLFGGTLNTTPNNQ